MPKFGRPHKQVSSRKRKIVWNHQKKYKTKTQKLQIKNAKSVSGLKKKLVQEKLKTKQIKNKAKRDSIMSNETINYLNNVMDNSIINQDDNDCDSESSSFEEYKYNIGDNEHGLALFQSEEKQLLFVFHAYAECNDGIDAIYKHLLFLRNTWSIPIYSLWSQQTISNYIRVRLPMLVFCLLGLEFVLNGPGNVTISFDDTTKNQKIFQHVMLSYSKTTSSNPISTSIAYIPAYSKSNDGLYEAVIQSIIRLNDYIKFWNEDANSQLLYDVYPNQPLCFNPIESRLVSVLTDRSSVNYKIVEKLKALNDNVIVHFTCMRHDLNNSVSILMKHQLKQRAIGLKSVGDVLSQCVFISRLFKPTSTCLQCKSSLFLSFVENKFPNKLDLVKENIHHLLCSKGQRKLNLLINCQSVLELIELINEFTSSKYDNKDVFSADTKNKLLLFCNNARIRRELVQSAFIFERLYMPFLGITKSTSFQNVASLMLLFVSNLENIDTIRIFDAIVGLGNPILLFDQYYFDVNELQEDITSMPGYTQVYNMLIGVRATLMLCDKKKQMVILCTDTWNAIGALTCYDEFLNKTANILLRHVLKMAIEDLVQFLIDVRDCCLAIAKYLHDQCDWGRYSNIQFHQNTAPNNTDALERGHGIASYALRNRFNISSEAIESLTLCRSNHLITKIIELHDNSTTKKIFDCVFEYVVNGGIRAMLRKNKENAQELQAKRSKYVFEKMSAKTNYNPTQGNKIRSTTRTTTRITTKSKMSN